MPTFCGDEAREYDKRIIRLVPGYDMLHQVVAAQLQVLLGDDSRILTVGAGSGREICELAAVHPGWRFCAQDISHDMLQQAQARFASAGIADRVSVCHGELPEIEVNGAFDVALCLLVLHFLPDDGSKLALLKAIAAHLKPGCWLLLADLMKPQTPFERDAQLLYCRNLGLTENGAERVRSSFEHEFYPLDRMRLAELLNQSGFDVPHGFFQMFGFSGYAVRYLG